MKPKQRKYIDPSSQSIAERAWNGNDNTQMNNAD